VSLPWAFIGRPFRPNGFCAGWSAAMASATGSAGDVKRSSVTEHAVFLGPNRQTARSPRFRHFCVPLILQVGSGVKKLFSQRWPDDCSAGVHFLEGFLCLRHPAGTMAGVATRGGRGPEGTLEFAAKGRGEHKRATCGGEGNYHPWLSRWGPGGMRGQWVTVFSLSGAA
jgi:hypothetical protein